MQIIVFVEQLLVRLILEDINNFISLEHGFWDFRVQWSNKGGLNINITLDKL